jgi:hypothetical protein
MTQVLRALRFDRMRALRALSRRLRSGAPWKIEHHFFVFLAESSRPR